MVVVPHPAAGGDTRGASTVETDDAGAPVAQVRRHRDLAVAVAEIESAHHPRWVWTSTASVYPHLLRAGVRVQRCHDLATTATITSMRAGTPGLPSDEPVDERPGLFDAAPAVDIDTVLAQFAEQRRVLSEDRRLDLLIAAESAGTLAAAEMGFDGLPFSADAHRRLLESVLGPRPAGYEPPRRIAEVTAEICAAFGRPLNPASHAEILDAFRREGIDATSTRKHVLKEIDHPAVPLLLRHRDLSKLYSTNGWHWLDTWVHGNRFRPVYVPGAVVSGRWASRGGGALQIPKSLRSSVIADPGHTFVVADAGQLEPRILAAMSGDRRMVAAAGADDLYAPVAAAAFNGDRAKAKVAVLGVLYGATSGDARSLLTVLRNSFPVAVDFVERAARAGERGEVVYSWLGRACPPPEPGFHSHGDVRARGRFTRNFVVQATAAEWALCVLAELRRRLTTDPDRTAGELVFFQHDEVVVHTRNPDLAAAHIEASVQSATRLLFGDTAVRFPMKLAVRDTYADETDGE
ncbi:bifunctional 3'-5' exonuclease/DNA polymerase [Rhodococcus chondri]|uniref:DNA-directed DNA polymerase n=1 Tax=Rhodococcus chondri TaxID=3065941 RepID=A0ABU7JPZ2_9NOCA|nr:bifunctional 3'-5' exonuclease/DNA polymerase [Rhodococcus sp. CC-R104]MEE2032090.1 bifunctional 3'-5' exonuclease/DNA polymerase [Rhodococcus sp. CC-R104]